MKRVLDFKKDFINKHPQLRDEVNDLFQLCLDEIEEGGSQDHEIYLFIGSCEDLLV